MRTFNKIMMFFGGSIRRLIVLSAIAIFFVGQFLGWWNSPSLLDVNLTVPQDTASSIPPPQSEPTSKPIWTKTRSLSAEENAEAHFKKHGHEFPFSNRDDYISAANDFVNSPPPGTQSVVQSDGDHVYYNEAKNYFAVVNRAGKIRTFFRLDPRIHGYPTNLDYFRAQEGR